jgi:hypothetical protein
MLNTNAGIYDLLKIQNDVTAVLTQDTKLPVGEITQLRLMLGTHNSLFISNDSEFSLTVPSAYNTGIKINVNTSVSSAQHLVITLDFNAERSIVVEGNGDYILNPVIEVKSVTSS